VKGLVSLQCIIVLLQTSSSFVSTLIKVLTDSGSLKRVEVVQSYSIELEL
jgi:hypothetical protein